MTPTPRLYASRLRSFAFALQGIVTLFRTQPNIWLHLLESVVVVIAGGAFRLSSLERHAQISAASLAGLRGPICSAGVCDVRL